MMRVIHFYDEATGLIAPTTISVSGGICDQIIALNTPAGHRPIEGVIDPLSQKVDLATGQIVDYQPPSPGEDYVWIHDDENGRRVRRWRLKADVEECMRIVAEAKARIVALEAKQDRALREHLLGITPTEEDRAAGAMTLEEIEAAICEQRAIINSPEAHLTTTAT